MTTDSATTKL